MSADVRPIAESELPDWVRTVHTGFLTTSRVTEADIALRAKYTDFSRTHGAFDPDSGRCVATLRSFPQEVTVPGGAAVRATAISNVGVLPTHRRQGLLTRLMAAEFAAAEARGDALMTLVAAEYPIYGRYGFGRPPPSWSGRSMSRAPGWTGGCRRRWTAGGSSWWTSRSCGGWGPSCTSGCGHARPGP